MLAIVSFACQRQHARGLSARLHCCRCVREQDRAPRATPLCVTLGSRTRACRINRRTIRRRGAWASVRAWRERARACRACAAPQRAPATACRSSAPRSVASATPQDIAQSASSVVRAAVRRRAWREACALRPPRQAPLPPPRRPPSPKRPALCQSTLLRPCGTSFQGVVLAADGCWQGTFTHAPAAWPAPCGLASCAHDATHTMPRTCMKPRAGATRCFEM